jgi:hypothetical protein
MLCLLREFPFFIVLQEYLREEWNYSKCPLSCGVCITGRTTCRMGQNLLLCYLKIGEHP